MGNTGEGERDPNERGSKFLCTSNKQQRSHNKTKQRRSKSLNSKCCILEGVCTTANTRLIFAYLWANYLNTCICISTGPAILVFIPVINLRQIKN